MAKIKEKKSEPTKLSSKHECSIVANGWGFASVNFLQMKKENKSKNLLGKALVKCWRYFFCSHKWKMTSSNRYNVKRGDGSKEGEVTLTLFECELCGKDKLVPSDRTHEKNTACT